MRKCLPSVQIVLVKSEAMILNTFLFTFCLARSFDATPVLGDWVPRRPFVPLFGFKGIRAHAARMAFAAFLVNGLVPLITTCILELAIVRWSLIVNLRSFQPVTADKKNMTKKFENL